MTILQCGMQSTRCPFSRSVWCIRGPGSSPLSGRKILREKLWREFFSDPSQWWDHRSGKANPKYPDFKHKKTQQALWIIDNLNPPWVQSELASMAPDVLQSYSFSWNISLRRHLKAGNDRMTLSLFQQMQREGVIPDKFTFLPVLNACSNLRSLEEGKRVHQEIIQRGCDSDLYIATCLVDMYAKCGSSENAWSVFNNMRRRDVVSWNAMIGGYVKSDQGLKAMELFRQLPQEGIEPDAVTFVGVLNACASIGALEEGRRVHEEIISKDYQSDVYVATCLVDMYAKCGSIGDAWTVFSKMLQPNVVTWNVIIGGYVKSEQGLKAMEMFQEMQQEGVEPDAVTFVGVLNACASVAALERGRRVHEQIIQRGFDSDVYVANCLIDMYGKCGSIEDAWSVFNKVREPNVVSWGAMIGGYAINGHSKKAVECFKRVIQEGVEFDGIIFLSLLLACSHGGLVKEGLRYFKSMTSCYGIFPTIEHYACMVDLYGRIGWLEQAGEMTKRMPMARNYSVWRSLLGACRIHGDVEMAEQAAKQCWELDPEDPSAHVLLSNIYAAAEMWDRSVAIEKEMLNRNVWREPGCTWIEVNNVVHPFVVNDKEHPQILEIQAGLERLSVQMNEAGYVPDTICLLHKVKKGAQLCHHSGKLTIADK